MSEYLRSGDPFLVDLWHDMTGRYYPLHYGEMPSLEEIRAIQWDKELEAIARCSLDSTLRPIFDEIVAFAKNRMVFSAFRYKPFTEQDLSKYDFAKAAKAKFDLFKKNKSNLEPLIDWYNYAMLYFIYKKDSVSKTELYDTYLAFPMRKVVLAYYEAKANGATVNSTDDTDHRKETVQ